ncbi:hypothetical protein WA1_20510 [Scytonema hofmannii PCC 7110]|uniref:Uncharacterized protein n=1 Tax=Scytonema hofmannii PCC 7110 TaxID=128403 RepID=A0A139XCC9_9CYAN|nr:hypothetical protein WA1_20510 [Scytonema hofmannii PCC 7110]
MVAGHGKITINKDLLLKSAKFHLYEQPAYKNKINCEKIIIPLTEVIAWPKPKEYLRNVGGVLPYLEVMLLMVIETEEARRLRTLKNKPAFEQKVGK